MGETLQSPSLVCGETREIHEYLSCRRDINEIMLLPASISQLTLSQTTNFIESSELKEFADDNFKFDENGRKLSKR